VREKEAVRIEDIDIGENQRNERKRTRKQYRTKLTLLV
jgi:hypothetical protein